MADYTQEDFDGLFGFVQVLEDCCDLGQKLEIRQPGALAKVMRRVLVGMDEVIGIQAAMIEQFREVERYHVAEIDKAEAEVERLRLESKIQSLMRPQ